MLHTFVGDDIDDVRDNVREPLFEYLRTSTDLIEPGALGTASSPSPTAQRTQPGEAQDLSELGAEEMAVIMDHAFRWLLRHHGVVGAPESCRDCATPRRPRSTARVFINFGVDEPRVLDGLRQLDALRGSPTRSPVPRPSSSPPATTHCRQATTGG